MKLVKSATCIIITDILTVTITIFIIIIIYGCNDNLLSDHGVVKWNCTSSFIIINIINKYYYSAIESKNFNST